MTGNTGNEAAGAIDGPGGVDDTVGRRRPRSRNDVRTLGAGRWQLGKPVDEVGNQIGANSRQAVLELWERFIDVDWRLDLKQDLPCVEHGR